jgi:folate-dependent phosphoribosylglycinamide formyltransferase PurN
MFQPSCLKPTRPQKLSCTLKPTRLTGCHLVVGYCDCGPILAQRTALVRNSDRPADITRRIEAIETQFFEETLGGIADKRITQRGD